MNFDTVGGNQRQKSEIKGHEQINEYESRARNKTSKIINLKKKMVKLWLASSRECQFDKTPFVTYIKEKEKKTGRHLF